MVVSEGYQSTRVVYGNFIFDLRQAERQAEPPYLIPIKRVLSKK